MLNVCVAGIIGKMSGHMPGTRNCVDAAWKMLMPMVNSANSPEAISLTVIDTESYVEMVMASSTGNCA